MEKHHENALALAKFLSTHPAVEKVEHPLLESHPGRQLALRQNGGRHSGMMALYVKDATEAKTMDVVNALKLVNPAVSLGGVHSLLALPDKTSHAMISVEVRRKMGITPNLIRLSVGIEGIEDLARDFDQALRKGTGIEFNADFSSLTLKD